MGATPLTATHRLVFQYTTQGKVHKVQHYAHLVTSGDATGFDATARSGYANPGCSGLCDAFFEAVKVFYKSSETSFDKMQGFKRTGDTWELLFEVTPTITPTGSGAGEKGFGLVLSGRDNANRNIPAFLAEGDFGPPQKMTAYASMSANEKKLVDYWFNVGGAAINTAAYVWRQARGTAITQRWIAWVVDTNEKFRRIRGMK